MYSKTTRTTNMSSNTVGIVHSSYRSVMSRDRPSCNVTMSNTGLIFIQKAFMLGLFLGELFSEGLMIGTNFAFQNGLGLTIIKA